MSNCQAPSPLFWLKVYKSEKYKTIGESVFPEPRIKYKLKKNDYPSWYKK